MKPEIKAPALRIIDFLSVLIPGFIWLILVVMTFQIVISRHDSIISSNPVTSLMAVVSFLPKNNSGLTIFSVLIASLSIGYAIKPLAMKISEKFTKYFFVVYKKYRKFKFKSMTFPFHPVFEHKEYYTHISRHLEKITGCKAVNLLGEPIFSAAKRYLRMTNLALWEEGEQMEAECRLIGSLLLASVYAFFVGGVAVAVIKLVHSAGTVFDTLLILWVFLSLIAIIVLSISFNRFRIREVTYTYLNFLLVAGSNLNEEKQENLTNG